MMPSILSSALFLMAVLPPQSGPANPTEPLVAEAIVGAPVEVIWDAFATREGFLAWHEIASSEIELRIGGIWRTSYDPESNLDDDSVIETEILAFDPGRMMATRTIRAPADFPFPNAILDTWTVLYFEPAGETKTRVMVRMFGFTDSEESREMRAFFDWGNPYELSQLVEYFAQR